MKVLSIKGNKVSLDLSELEENILFVNGLQLWIDKNYGKNKVKVLPVEKWGQTSKTKNINKIEVDDEFTRECIQISVVDALERMMKREGGVP